MSRHLKIMTEVEENGIIIDQIELVTEGNVQSKNGKWYIRYDESELTGLENTKTMIKIDNENILIQKKGQVKSNLNICLNEEKESIYQTPYGSLDMLTKGYEFIVDLDEEGKGLIEIFYSISINEEPEKNHRLKIICQ